MSATSHSHATASLMHPDDAIPALLDQVATTEHSEMVQLSDALGRVLAEDLASGIDLPPFNNSAMDGYAYRFADLAQYPQLTLIGESFAGHAFDEPYQAGSCVRIMTGAPVPAGYDTVQMQEKVDVDGNNITILGAKQARENVRHQGEELVAGTKVLSAGIQIGAAELGVLATIGISKLRVYRKLTVAFFSTGDELRPVGSELAPGQIYDSNRYSIKGLLERTDVEAIDMGVIADDPEAIRQAFRNAAAQADMVITSGGVSVGDADYTKQVLEEEGEITFWKLAIKPGKPFAFGHLGNAVFCGLPGNPVSSMVTFYKLVLPLIRKMKGLPQQPPLLVNATLSADLRKLPGRVEYQRGVYQRHPDGRIEVSVTGSQGSGMLTSMSVANCFIVLPQDQENPRAGSTVTIEPFNSVLC